MAGGPLRPGDSVAHLPLRPILRTRRAEGPGRGAACRDARGRRLAPHGNGGSGALPPSEAEHPGRGLPSRLPTAHLGNPMIRIATPPPLVPAGPNPDVDGGSAVTPPTTAGPLSIVHV